MACFLCATDLGDRVFFRRSGWFALLDANPILPGHSIVARERFSESCPTELNSTNMLNVDRVLPVVVDALKSLYTAENVLLSSLSNPWGITRMRAQSETSKRDWIEVGRRSSKSPRTLVIWRRT